MKEVIKINENTWRIEDDGVRFYLLSGSEKAALIDTGMNSPDAKQIAEGLTKLPLILINTHADPDHTPGSVGIIDKNNRVLISGDSVQDGNIFMFGRGRNLTQYIQSLKHLSQFEEQFNDIYPMHGTFPVNKDLIPKLIQGAQAILDGNAQEYAQPVNVFGNDVTLYKFDYAGFLYQK
jgi:glyoxylase-like metal-dependent hydrolase (beta-lactamase superfamily II)